MLFSYKVHSVSPLNLACVYSAKKAGTTVLVEGLFKPLPVRRKELERNAKREFAKALNLLNAYALVPCAKENKGVRLSVFHQPEGG